MRQWQLPVILEHKYRRAALHRAGRVIGERVQMRCRDHVHMSGCAGERAINRFNNPGD